MISKVKKHRQLLDTDTKNIAVSTIIPTLIQTAFLFQQASHVAISHAQNWPPEFPYHTTKQITILPRTFRQFLIVGKWPNN
jgi:short-subunit dehydrogenase